MKQNNWVTCNTPITEYICDSKGIRLVSSKKPRHNALHKRPKPAADKKKREESK
ncbi:MAG: hypothetical protein OXI30_18385 [Chloroflexota bacterium]|nr:hypothetical protein [Chloroflexota bacterium]